MNPLPQRMLSRVIFEAGVASRLCCAPPVAGFTLEVSLVFPAQHAVRLIHVVSLGTVRPIL
jgi:hypothetical protein